METMNLFDAKVDQQIERFRTQSYRALEADSTERRVHWYKQHGIHTRPGATPREGYELFFFDYLGLSEDQVPVLSETDTEIMWSSINPCQTLEACKQIGLDTRVVCRAIYEKSTQAFLSQIDPQLRFLRSYEEIRPYSHHCKERIVRLNFEEMMTIAIGEAQLSRKEGNKGYGAVIVLGQQIIGQSHDTATSEHDPSLHAEVNAIREAVKTTHDTNLSGAVLLSTCEPCPMCTSLAVWANLTTIVYGVSIEETARLGKTRILLPASEIIDRSPVMIEVVADVLADQCRALYT
jgi:tRNA(Arg) A34 adenosine deaminase TadA